MCVGVFVGVLLFIVSMVVAMKYKTGEVYSCSSLVKPVVVQYLGHWCPVSLLPERLLIIFLT